MNRAIARNIEEKRILLESLKESNEGDKELSKIDYDLIQGCFNVMRTHSLIPQKTRGFKRTLSSQLEDLVDLAMAKEDSIGIVSNPISINPKEVVRVIYDFTIKYVKSKGVKGNNRKHTDTITLSELDEESALLSLNKQLKRKKEALVEVVEIRKKHLMYELENGSTVLCSNIVSIINS
jgi:hypothetical protein